MIVITMSQSKYLAVLKATATLWCTTSSTETPSEFTRLAASNIIRL